MPLVEGIGPVLGSEAITLLMMILLTPGACELAVSLSATDEGESTPDVVA